MVADSSYAVSELLKQVSDTPDVSRITRLRLEAALYAPASCACPPATRATPEERSAAPDLAAPTEGYPHAGDPADREQVGGGGGTRTVEICTETAVWYQRGLPPVELCWVLIRDPQDEFEPPALLSTRLTHQPAQIVEWFVRRWTMEVTVEEARAHLGLETPRQWNDWAIQRTTPALFGLYSLVTRLAHGLVEAEARGVRTAAW